MTTNKVYTVCKYLTGDDSDSDDDPTRDKTNRGPYPPDLIKAGGFSLL